MAGSGVGGSSRLHRAAQLVEASGGSPDADHVRGDRLAPLGVGSAGDGDIGDARALPHTGLDRLGPDVLTAGDDQVATAAVDVQSTVVEPAAEVAGREPAVTKRVGAVAVALSSIGPAEQDLPVGGDADATPSSGTPS